MSTDSVESLLASLCIGAARTLPLAWLVPVMGGRHAPFQVRFGLGFVLALLALSSIQRAPLPDPLGPALLAVLLAREVAVGLTLGLLVAFLFQAAEAAGRLADTLRGANLAEVISLGAEERTSPLADVGLLVFGVLFLEIGGLPQVATAVARSYEAVPLGTAPSLENGRAVAENLILASARLVESAVALAAPVIVAFLLADLALATLARAAPHLPVTFVAMPAKALLGVGTFLVGLGTMETVLIEGMGGLTAYLEAGLAWWKR